MRIYPRTIGKMEFRHQHKLLLRQMRGGVAPIPEIRKPRFRVPRYRWDLQRFRFQRPKCGAFDRRFGSCPF